MLVSSQVCAPLAQHWNLSCSNEATNYFCNCNILVGSTGGYDLHLQEHSDTEFMISYESIMDTLEELLLALLLQLVGNIIFPISRLLTISMSVRSSFLDDVVGN